MPLLMELHVTILLNIRNTFFGMIGPNMLLFLSTYVSFSLNTIIFYIYEPLLEVETTRKKIE